MTLVLYFAPLLLLAGLLLCGRFVGEERILARRATAFTRGPLRAPRSVRRPASARAVVSLLARAVHVEAWAAADARAGCLTRGVG